MKVTTQFCLFKKTVKLKSIPQKCQKRVKNGEMSKAKVFPFSQQ